ncbi:hypothetical protein [Oceanobacillus jeddahense]|uniref:Lipoprotein n=1 Tax=Oceanobacillus jeddahense TaxID=1462527 RepID=A0ABY5JTT5_9BACI|nr:hypothetical protein [Oceanobacillus jeddahense]UUI02588.1 hypothetical protein NP439_21530 [Oceanobacillus jeddahense]
MKKVLLKVGASALALTLMTGCGTSNDNEPADENPTIDHEEREDEFNGNNNDNNDNDPMDENNFDEREEEMPRNNE